MDSNLLNLTNRQLNSVVLVVQGLITIFSAFFISVYLLGLWDLPETVVYHSDPTFRTLLSAFGSLSLIFIGVALVLSIVVKTKE